MRIPLPALVIDATEHRWSVVDGEQRLVVLARFVLDDALALTGLEFLPDQSGATYSRLPRPQQRRILETQVPVLRIEPGTPPAVARSICRRIQTGRRVPDPLPSTAGRPAGGDASGG